MPDLAFLVDAEGDTRLAGSAQALLYRLEVELVLVEDAGERAERFDRSSPRLVSAEPGLLNRGRSFAGERGEEQDLHDAAAVVVAVGPEAVGDLVVAAPRVHVREHR